jgi:RNA polymerase sigma-70 factor, ECF subfamily
MADMTTATTIDEQSIIIQAQQGDPHAFSELVKLYQKRAYGIAYQYVGNREDALEMAQDSFVKAYKAMKRFDTQMPFYPWLYRIVKNTCLNYLKKKKRRGEVSLNAMMHHGYDIASSHRDGERRVHLSELRDSIADAMTRLSESHREIVLLRHVHDMSYSEIADSLDIPRGTVMSRLHGARRNLRQAMEVTQETG